MQVINWILLHTWSAQTLQYTASIRIELNNLFKRYIIEDLWYLYNYMHYWNYLVTLTNSLLNLVQYHREQVDIQIPEKQALQILHHV